MSVIRSLRHALTTTRLKSRGALALELALLVVATGCGTATISSGSSQGGSSRSSSSGSGSSGSRHIVLVMEENQSYSTVVGDTANWPNLNNLIKDGSLATNYYGNSHPSIPNYFMLTTGQTLTHNDGSTKVWDVDNIARRMLADGVSFRIYAEGIKRGYVGGNTGPYLVRHNPFAMLPDIADHPQVANQHIWPFTQFAIDAANNALPVFSYIVPDVDDDAHSASAQRADTWLQSKVVQPLSSYSAFQPGGNGILIIDFDEAATSDTRHGGGHISPVFWGPGAKSGYKQTSDTLYQHESMLRSIMEELGLPNPPAAAATAPSMSEFFVHK
ncbi:MAG: alkaline phosphatase family protein [Acidobacteriaceae bacterium]